MPESMIFTYLYNLWLKFCIWRRTRKCVKEGHEWECLYEVANYVNEYGVKQSGDFHRTQCERCGARTRWLSTREYRLFHNNQEKYWPHFYSYEDSLEPNDD